MRDLTAHSKLSAPTALRGSTSRYRVLAAVATLCAGTALCSCGKKEETYTPSQASSAMNFSTIAPATVTGRIAGRPFTARDIWYRVQRKAGRHRIDLVISEGRQTRLCAESDPEESRHVWVRFPEWQRFVVGEYRVDPSTTLPAPTAMSVHYEAPEEQHRFEGNQTASAIVSIDSAVGDTVTGRMRACFGDAEHSCIEGTFRAIECRPELEPDSPNAGNYRRREAPSATAYPQPAPAATDGGAAP
jgi:hypothetical protein